MKENIIIDNNKNSYQINKSDENISFQRLYKLQHIIKKESNIKELCKYNQMIKI